MADEVFHMNRELKIKNTSSELDFHYRNHSMPDFSIVCLSLSVYWYTGKNEPLVKYFLCFYYN
jgi:hypothetical protein